MKVLTTIDLLALPSLETPPAGHVGFGAKSDGLYQRIGTVETKLSVDGHTHTIAQITGLQGALDSKATQSDIDTAIDGIEIGGRNLLPNSNIVAGWSSNSFNEVSSYHYTTNVQIATGAFIYKWFDLDGNHIFQIQVKTNDENLLGKTIIWQSGGKDVSEKPITLSEDWQTLISVPLEGENVAVGLRIVEGTGGELLSRYLKLEKGNKATDWTPAPEDQVSDWSESNASSLSFIKNKPTLLSQFTDNIGVASHIANKANPHNVTTAQIGAVDLTTSQTITGAKTFSALLTASVGVNTPKVDFGNGFTIEPSGAELVFKYNGVIKQRMLSDGTILATGEVTAFGTTS